MTTRALPRVAAELALPALTVAFGLQLRRLMVATVVSDHPDRLGALALLPSQGPPDLAAMPGWRALLPMAGVGPAA